ncbi:Ohr subfamily peroxiredoxin [Prauserella shujinwangii]|uniref:Ohr subfamily peroxiredoxin n=1 Tax=Prauserella shujinwangii TaxID=1453103 RepID=A0A2T0LNJ3_9PSEU|nr:organic hydroperoxide resistance protein [Prauserella shujinwangii]PRX44756.1 Ohr subfamily peroxiredoxin [Prauserella shujinwangii]
MADAIYTATATARGDGRDGEVTSSDGVLDEKLAVPKELGGPGGSFTNPEQLFAAGYSACFHGALRAVAGKTGVELGETEVTVDVHLGKTEAGQFALAVDLTASLPGMEQGKADELVAQAHQTCPYSSATRGNIAVTVSART